MQRYPPRTQIFAAALAAIAGFVDATGFLVSGGYFVSFMSGNSTRVAVGLIEGGGAAIVGLGLIGAFVSGVTAGALIGRAMPLWRAPAVLALVAATLAAAAALLTLGATSAGLALLAFAMGAENAVFAQDGDVRIGLTYMTGALVKLGKGLADLLMGRRRAGWVPFAGLWLALMAGASLGALAIDRFGLAALWGAALATVLAAAVAARTRIVTPHLG